MTNRFYPDEITATDLRLALNEVYPDSNYGAIPAVDQYDAVEAFRAYDDGSLAEAPQALDAYVAYLQHHAD